MEVVETDAEDLSQPAITNVREFATEQNHAALAIFLARSVAAIQDATENVMSLARLVPRIVLGLAFTASVVQCHAQFLAT